MCGTCDEQSNHRPRKQKSLKRKRNECPENDRKNEEPPKCPKPKRPSVKVKKCLTRIEKIMLRIQPPIADRERYLHPYHVNCFLEESERVSIKKPMCGPCPAKRQKICGQGTKKKPPNENAEGETEVDHKTKNQADATKDNNVKTGNGEENDATSDSTKQEGEEKRENKEEKKMIKDEKAEWETTKTKNNRRNSRKKKRKMKKQEVAIKEVSDSETSIHSNDSEVCLFGLRLSKADKEQIEKNRDSTHTPQDNDDKGATNTEGIQEATKQESKDTE